MLTEGNIKTNVKNIKSDLKPIGVPPCSKYKDGYHNHMEALVSEYEDEECNFSDQGGNVKLLDMYTSRMEDCHLKCVLYMFLKNMKEN